MSTKFGHLIEKPKKSIIGKRFGRLLVTEYVAGSRLLKIKSRAICICDCGNSTITQIQSLNSGGTKSCGCLRDEKVKKRMTIHGLSGSSEYVAWENMKDRCYYEKYKSYKHYGGRGITVCVSWLDKEYGFLNFFRDMGKKPSSKYSLDRINNDGNYEPSNCRWATRSVQAANQRKKHINSITRNRGSDGKFAKKENRN